jgi:hypothetical protein
MVDGDKMGRKRMRLVSGCSASGEASDGVEALEASWSREQEGLEKQEGATRREGATGDCKRTRLVKSLFTFGGELVSMV